MFQVHQEIQELVKCIIFMNGSLNNNILANE